MNEPIDENERIRRLMELDKSRLPSDGGPGFNRLIFAASPYLLQHATNPVDWYPWGEEAFARAAAEDKPVFLSIGYATCHWCHVMEREAFENHEVAEVFNRHFVCIKVDREERPDIDDQYMAVAQMITGSGGWPLNIFMTPEKKAFYAATYLPRTPRQGLPGIIDILEKVAEIWRLQRERLERDSLAATQALEQYSRPSGGSLPDEELFRGASLQLAEMYDSAFGGFGNAPKFPMPVYLSFLLRFWKRHRDAAALEMVEHSLQMMRRGGVYDQLGFGFHRYSVDRHWFAPHFEKMLYDQALIATAYLEAHQATGVPLYREVAEEIFTYVLREMTSVEGGFFAGQDADTEGEEGKYYLWTPAEVASVIGRAEAALFCRLFDVTEKGNFEGRSILHLPASTEHFADREGIIPGLLDADLQLWREKLLKVRMTRIRPFRDEKIITAWNGLMIAALAKGYSMTSEERYLSAARGAAAFIGSRLTTAGGRLMRSYHHEKASVPAFLEDYAFFAWGLVELHQATLDPVYLDQALSLTEEMLRLFDGDAGDGLYETGKDAEQLPVWLQSVRDGVLPSGNGMAAYLLFRLSRITGAEEWQKRGEVIVGTFMGDVSRQPAMALNLLSGLDYRLGPEVTVTLAGNREELGELLQSVHRRFIPNLAVRHGDVSEFPPIGGAATAYVCAAGTCRPPVTGASALDELLERIG